MLKSEWLESRPLEHAVSLAAPLYTDPQVLALEQRAVFGANWQLLGPAAALAQPGDHVVGEIGATPVLALRSEDGSLRGFHNVCRHRGGPLAFIDGRGAKALQCKYHGWTYTLAGQLRSAPEMQDARDFDMARICLPAIRVESWQGLVFGALGEAPALHEALDGIAAQAPATFNPPLQFSRRVSYELDCNWKVYVDNFLEGYHLPHIHPGLNKLLDYRSYTTTLGRWQSLQHSPLEDAGGIYGKGGAFYWFVYPNIMLNCLPGRLQTNRVLPLNAERCRIDFDYYYAQGADPVRGEQDQGFSDEVQAEDAQICAAVQKGLASGSYVPGRLNPKRESGVHHFHELLREAYRKER
ncbi:MAG TPA: aromatic ring-hydroxylating dioxygenase subunit alpha [Verrucomicrobiae bacterium]|nr:aromatic ring-hydroxylating dioxygenase subunit alpha [Verrucomicrobiae bacterium]